MLGALDWKELTSFMFIQGAFLLAYLNLFLTLTYTVDRFNIWTEISLWPPPVPSFFSELSLEFISYNFPYRTWDEKAKILEIYSGFYPEFKQYISKMPFLSYTQDEYNLDTPAYLRLNQNGQVGGRKKRVIKEISW